MARPLSLKIALIGKGKVGVALAAAARTAGARRVTLRAAREGLPRRPLDADLVILCVRDRELGPLAEALSERRLLPQSAVCVHVAGALDAEVLAPLRRVCRGVAQMHPMISFAAKNAAPSLMSGNVHIDGDPRAVRRARAFARAIGMTPRTIPRLDTVGYHAAAAFVANGAAALAALGAEILERAGVPANEAPKMLGPLLRSVAENVEHLGFPGCLTGPIRRGDPGAIAKHAAVLRERVPPAVPLYVELGLAQVPLARALGDAPPEGLVAIEKSLISLKRALSRRGLPPNPT